MGAYEDLASLLVRLDVNLRLADGAAKVRQLVVGVRGTLVRRVQLRLKHQEAPLCKKSFRMTDVTHAVWGEHVQVL